MLTRSRQRPAAMSEALALPRAVMKMRRGRVASQAVLMAAFAASVAAFCAAAFYTEGRLQSVDLRLDTIAEETMPEIIALTEFRDSLHAAEVDLAAGVGGQSWSFDFVSTSVANARRAWARYANLHARSEVTVPPVIEQALLAIGVVGDALRAGRGDDARAAFADERPKAARAEMLLGTLTEARAADGADLARRAEMTRTRTARFVLALDGVGVGLACALALLSLRSLRRHGRILEDRAADFEAFADRVAHDVRGPLGPALYALDRAEELVSDDPGARNVMARGRRSLRVVVNLVADLLEFARSGAGHDPNARSGVRAVLDDVLSELEPTAAGLGISLDVEPFEDFEAACGEGVLASILGNLIRNAVAHMGDATTRKILVRVDSACTARIRIEIEDTGPGIREEDLERVFQPYARGCKTGGLGLGLATVQRLVNSHGGTIAARARAGGGTIFTVALPTHVRTT